MSGDRYPQYYPIECEHGFDCCPMCDREALKADAMERRRRAKARAERFADPYDTASDVVE